MSADTDQSASNIFPIKKNIKQLTNNIQIT